MPRFLRMSYLVACFAVVAMCVAAPAASADAYGCHGSVCIKVRGHGLYVSTVTVYKTLGPRRTDGGYYYFFQDGRRIHTSNYHFLRNESWFHSHRWESSWTINRWLASGTRICGSWANPYGGGPCETVHG